MIRSKKFYFIGICGTAMGSVAAAFQERGYKISGSDNAVYPPMSTLLENLGVEIKKGYNPDNLPPDADLYVIGNAVSRGNVEVEAVLERKLPYTSLPEILQWEVMQGKRNFVVTGTHGKTTTTSMLTWLLEDNLKNPSYMIGGVPANFEVGARFTDSDFFVIEGDEYDSAFFDKRSKFLRYLPELVIVNNIEFDHADIFNSLDDILLSFSRLLRVVPKNGCVLLNGDLESCRSLIAACPAPVVTVGLGKGNDKKIVIKKAKPESTEFTVDGVAFTVPMVGEFNVRNAAMAICAAQFAGLSNEEIRATMLTFKGVQRRQTVRGEKNGITIIDDFGHHPTAIREALRGLKQMYPKRRLWALFEPRSNTSMRNTLQAELIEALKVADGSIIASVHAPDKVAPELRLDVDAVAAAVREAGGESYHETGVDAIIDRLKAGAKSGDVAVVFSNGGFDGIHQKLLDRL